MKSILGRIPFGLLIALAALGSACETSTQPAKGAVEVPSSSAPAAAEPIVVRVSGEHFRLGGGKVDESTRKELKPNAVLKSGEGYSLKVALSRPAFVYLLQFKPNGSGEILYPAGGDPRGAQEVHRIPGEEDVTLRLDEVTGPEVLFLVVSEQPIAVADPAIAAVMREVGTMPADSILPVTIETQEDAAAAVTEPPAAPSPQKQIEDQKPAPAPKAAGCAAVTVPAGVKVTARGCPGASRQPVTVTARGTVRVRDGAELLHAVADAGGVVSYAIQFEHQ